MPNNPQNPPSPLLVEILAFPDVQLLDVTGPLQVFASANDWALANGMAQPYLTRVVAAASPVMTSSGLGLVSSPLSRTDAVDTLMVAGGGGVHAATRDPRLIRWFVRRASHARRVASICTGAFLLGAAGLLQDKRVVTHWSECARLARQYPSARVEVDPIFIRDGPIWTSAGVTAGMDLALAMVAQDMGHPLSMTVARDLVVLPRRPGGQAQFSNPLSLQRGASDFDPLHGWIAGHLSGDLSVAALAAKAAMSERSFVRHYRASTGLTPARAVEKMRVEAAQHLLMSTRMPVKRIAERCGFGSEETLRRSFHRQLATAPRDYRNRFAPAHVKS